MARCAQFARGQRGGFTLIELLMVMAIIATLASLGIYGIPRLARQADVTACKAHLASLNGQFSVYVERHKGMPAASGTAFVFALWESGLIDHTLKDTEVLLCPSMKGKFTGDVTQFTADDVDYTGPNQEGARRRLRPHDKNAHDTIIVCDRVLTVVDDSDRKQLPHSEEGVCYLTLGGAVDFIEASEFGEAGYVILGPDSPVEKFKSMMPDQR